jgi:hypothetical protein
MFRGAFYRHPNCTDTCIEVLTYFYVPEKKTAKVKARWWRVQFGKVAYCMGFEEKWERPEEYWKQWERIGSDLKISGFDNMEDTKEIVCQPLK